MNNNTTSQSAPPHSFFCLFFGFFFFFVLCCFFLFFFFYKTGNLVSYYVRSGKTEHFNPIQTLSLPTYIQRRLVLMASFQKPSPTHPSLLLIRRRSKQRHTKELRPASPTALEDWPEGQPPRS